MSKIAVYLTGGIADYKAVEVVRGLQKLSHQIKVGMTKNAENFVGKQTLAALTKNEVLDDLWAPEQQAKISHIELADWSDLALVVPATANIIAKIANGIADDAVSTAILATSSPILVVPAMNTHMWGKASVQRNIEQMKSDGIQVLEPTTGFLAEGYSGKGRMPEVDDIVKWVNNAVSDRSFSKKIVITAGGTREPIDPVRYIGNRSSGKMGIALAQASANAGFSVELIVGTVSVPLPQNFNIHITHVETTEEMLKSVESKFKSADALVMAAAVADYKVKNYVDHKIKKISEDSEYQLELEQTPDILKTMGHSKNENQLVIGFAAETNDVLTNAKKKVLNKNADLIVANDVSKNVFGNDEDEVVILSKNSEPQFWPKMSKIKVAQKLVGLIKSKLRKIDEKI